MHALYSELPRTVNGLPVRTDWRVMAEFENGLYRTKSGGEGALVRASLAAFYCAPPPDENAAWQGLLWFYRCGKDPPKTGTGGSRRRARPYDFDVDAELVYASFWQAYRLDLTRSRMHWWQFRALFNGLPEKCPLGRVIGYRTAELDGLPEKQRAFYEQMRALYALPKEVGGEGIYAEPVTQADAEAAFIARLRRA